MLVTVLSVHGKIMFLIVTIFQIIFDRCFMSPNLLLLVGCINVPSVDHPYSCIDQFIYILKLNTYLLY